MSEIDWSKAPEGATHFYPDFITIKWYSHGLEGWKCFSPTDGEWRPSKNKPEFFDFLIPRPTQWRGPEDGLPPVGAVCEYQSDVRSWQAGDRVEVLAHRRAKVDSVAVVWNLRAKQARGVIAGVLRPLKSDKERAVEAAMGSISNITTMEWKCRRQFLEQCYDAGLLRLPEEQS